MTRAVLNKDTIVGKAAAKSIQPDVKDELAQIRTDMKDEIEGNLLMEDNNFCCGIVEFSNGSMVLASDAAKLPPAEFGQMIIDDLLDNEMGGKLATTVIITKHADSNAQPYEERIYERALVAVGFKPLARWTHMRSKNRLALYGKLLQR